LAGTENLCGASAGQPEPANLAGLIALALPVHGLVIHCHMLFFLVPVGLYAY
jgi:hypothetical protein